MTCEDCLLEWEDCVCGQVDRFFDENKGLFEDLDEPSLDRCLGCFSIPCSCKSGHGKRLEK